jgi:hypothetical protein
MISADSYLDINGLKQLYKRCIHAQIVLDKKSKLEIFIYKTSRRLKFFKIKINPFRICKLRSPHCYINACASNFVYFSGGKDYEATLDCISYFGDLIMRRCDECKSIDSNLELLFSLVEFRKKFFFDPTLIKNT